MNLSMVDNVYQESDEDGLNWIRSVNKELEANLALRLLQRTMAIDITAGQ